MNKDEAERTFGIAKAAFAKGNYEEALKFFKISHRLDKSDITMAHIIKCEEKIQTGAEEYSNGQGNNNEEPKTNNNEQQHTSKKKTEGAVNETKNEEVNGGSPDFTPEQAAEVNKFLKLKDFYEILGVQKSATEDEIKKAYRKMALKFHPDKCRAPKAHEAFTKVGQAYDCLSNKDKRQYYDDHGNETPDQRYQHYTQHYHYEHFSPEDMFEMFFGIPSGRRRGHMQHGGGNFYYYSSHGGGGAANGQQAQGTRSKYTALLQFLPLILILFSSVIMNFKGEEESVFSLMKNSKYPYPRTSHKLGIQYFVQPDFNSKYGQNQRELIKVEQDVEEAYARGLYRQCESNKAQRDKILMHARWSYGSDKERLTRAANEVDLSICQEYNNVVRKLGSRRW